MVVPIESGAQRLTRERVNIALPKECLSWIDKKIDGRVCTDRGHAIEVLILKAVNKEKGK